MSSITRSQLIEKLIEKIDDFSSVKASAAVHAICDAIKETLKQGNRVEVRGFGSFVVRSYPAYSGRNPKTGESIQVAAKKLPFFKVGKELKVQLNPNQADS